MATDQTAAAPPIRGSTILANIGSIANSNSAERNNVAAYRVGTKRADVERSEIPLWTSTAVFLAGLASNMFVFFVRGAAPHSGGPEKSRSRAESEERNRAHVKNGPRLDRFKVL